MSRARRIYRKKIASYLPYGIFLFIPIVFILLIITVFSDGDDDVVNQEIISPVVQESGVARLANVIPDILSPFTSKDFDKSVRNILKGEKGEYSVIYKNLKNGDTYVLNETKEYASASLYKLFVMAKVYEEIESGKLAKDTIVSDTVERLNERFDIASDEAEMTEGSFRMSIETALDQMITISHNYAALLLTSKITTSSVKDFIKRNGFTNTEFSSPPRTTPQDIMLFYEKLYKKELVSETASVEMMGILKRQELNDRIPKYLPKSIISAHKTGELGGVKHDAGIVFSEKGDYILVLMSETNAPQHAAEVEARISEEVFKVHQD